ncbi:MAG: hypothetical protein GY915_00745, partial [bacterium]|nr:hypothetical protein [bacterium]
LMGSNVEELTPAHGYPRSNKIFLSHDITHFELFLKLAEKFPNEIEKLKSLHTWASQELSDEDFVKHLIFSFVILRELPVEVDGYDLSLLSQDLDEFQSYILGLRNQFFFPEGEYVRQKINEHIRLNMITRNQKITSFFDDNTFEKSEQFNSFEDYVEKVSLREDGDYDVEFKEGVFVEKSRSTKIFSDSIFYDHKVKIEGDLADLVTLAGYPLLVEKNYITPYKLEVTYDQTEAFDQFGHLIEDAIDLWKTSGLF